MKLKRVDWSEFGFNASPRNIEPRYAIIIYSDVLVVLMSLNCFDSDSRNTPARQSLLMSHIPSDNSGIWIADGCSVH